ncbi:MFS transporter [Naasia lichenicola]|uniref:MFS transporter n=1 Tax=Naasia lichenicola TaxID=2565933 RepID=UPI001E4E2DD8|nr:MFS transporter [Naasia lichenicola]
MTGRSSTERTNRTRGARGPLAHAAFRWLLAARTTAVLGNAAAPIALAFAVLDLTGSPADLGLVVAARSVASVAILLLGGVIADRLPRSLILVGTSIAAAATQFAVAALVLTGSATIPGLVVLSVLNGAVAAVSLPASAALIPDTVPPQLLRPANALLRLSLNAGTIVGASLGAALVGLVGPGWGWSSMPPASPLQVRSSLGCVLLQHRRRPPVHDPRCSPISSKGGASSRADGGSGSSWRSSPS